MRRLVWLFVMLLGLPAWARAQAPALTLSSALAQARAKQPQIAASRASATSAEALVTETRAPLLPQLVGTASYQRTTANFVARPGFVQNQQNSQQSKESFRTFNFYNLGATASQLIYDFGQSSNALRAAKSSREASLSDLRASELAVELSVRTAFFEAQATRALVRVADEALQNQARHLQQAQAFVDVGTRPEIDVAQARTEMANARVQLIQAENAYALAKARLRQAMGLEDSTPFEVAEETLPALSEEEAAIDALLRGALSTRPELQAFQGRLKAQQLLKRSAQGAYGPSLSVATSVTDSGAQLDDLTWNWNAGVFLNWPMLQGGLTEARTRQARAEQMRLEAELSSLRQRIHFELEEARLSIRAAKATVAAADEALLSARDRLKLAEGRYAAGVGNVIELGDAQLALSNAEAQRVRAEYDLSTARAMLLYALGKQGDG